MIHYIKNSTKTPTHICNLYVKQNKFKVIYLRYYIRDTDLIPNYYFILVGLSNLFVVSAKNKYYMNK